VKETAKLDVDQMIAAFVVKSTNTNDLVVRFHEDCNLRGMVSAMDYILEQRSTVLSWKQDARIH
jgi:hypothetical protein